MQSPTASDPSFKAFLEDLQKQNNQSFVTQIFQLKAEREIAGKDGDKREEQLHDINETLKDLKAAVTGIKLEAPAIDFTPVVDSLSNVTEVLLKSLEEHNKQAYINFAAINNLNSGFACPKCGEEMFYSSVNSTLLTYPPKRIVNRWECNYTDHAY